VLEAPANRKTRVLEYFECQSSNNNNFSYVKHRNDFLGDSGFCVHLHVEYWPSATSCSTTNSPFYVHFDRVICPYPCSIGSFVSQGLSARTKYAWGKVTTLWEFFSTLDRQHQGHMFSWYCGIPDVLHNSAVNARIAVDFVKTAGYTKTAIIEDISVSWFDLTRQSWTNLFYSTHTLAIWAMAVMCLKYRIWRLEELYTVQNIILAVVSACHNANRSFWHHICSTETRFKCLAAVCSNSQCVPNYCSIKLRFLVCSKLETVKIKMSCKSEFMTCICQKQMHLLAAIGFDPSITPQSFLFDANQHWQILPSKGLKSSVFVRWYQNILKIISWPLFVMATIDEIVSLYHK